MPSASRISLGKLTESTLEKFGTDGTGVVGAEELYETLKTHISGLTMEHVQAAVKEADVNKDEKLEMNEVGTFLDAVLKGVFGENKDKHVIP
ncbi:hypothetical protein SprV_0301319600 [Sparganum proliferum]